MHSLRQAALMMLVPQVVLCLSSPWHLLLKTFQHCGSNATLTSCLKSRSLIVIDRLTRDPTTIPLAGMAITLVQDMEGISTGRSLTPGELDSSLPTDPGTREDTLDNMLLKAVAGLLRSRSLKIKIPEGVLYFLRNNWSQGRGKKNKNSGALAMGMMMLGGTLIPIGLGAIALLAGKAIMLAMMSLLMSLLLALRKSPAPHHGSTTYEVINVPPAHHGHHSRSIPQAYSEHLGPDYDGMGMEHV